MESKRRHRCIFAMHANQRGAWDRLVGDTPWCWCFVVGCGLFWVFCVLCVVLCGWFVVVCDTPWVVACLLGFGGVGLWVVCVFAGGGVCSSLAASRGGGRLGLVVFASCVVVV